MQSRMNKAQVALLTERGFTVQHGGRHAFRTVGGWNRQSLVCRRSGWSWHSQDLRSYKMVGIGSGLLCPISAYTDAEVTQWQTM